MSARPLPATCRGDGPPLVLLHGFTGSAQGLTRLAEALARDYRVLAPDLPGHGRSLAHDGLERCSFDACVEDLLATLAAGGHACAHWLGYSMGARLALGCAVRRPAAVRSLVLLGARAGILEPAQRAARRAADEALAGRIEREGIEAFVDEWLAQPLFDTQRRLGPAFLAAARAERLAHTARGLAASLRGMGLGAQPPLFDALPRIAAPTLLVAGALDERFVATAHDLARRLPRAEVCELADAGHAAHLERPEPFVTVVRDFLRRADGVSHAEHREPSMETLS